MRCPICGKKIPRGSVYFFDADFVLNRTDMKPYEIEEYVDSENRVLMDPFCGRLFLGALKESDENVQVDFAGRRLPIRIDDISRGTGACREL